MVRGAKSKLAKLKRLFCRQKKIGFPIMIKAALGGGGKGMRVSVCREDFLENFRMAQTETLHAFADNAMYLERYIEKPRHIEVQILADKQGQVIQLGERDCSIQRRHQKLIEESPSCAVSPKVREQLGETACQASGCGYESAETIEFLFWTNPGNFSSWK